MYSPFAEITLLLHMCSRGGGGGPLVGNVLWVFPLSPSQIPPMLSTLRHLFPCQLTCCTENLTPIDVLLYRVKYVEHRDCLFLSMDKELATIGGLSGVVSGAR